MYISLKLWEYNESWFFGCWLSVNLDWSRFINPQSCQLVPEIQEGRVLPKEWWVKKIKKMTRASYIEETGQMNPCNLSSNKSLLDSLNWPCNTNVVFPVCTFIKQFQTGLYSIWLLSSSLHLCTFATFSTNNLFSYLFGFTCVSNQKAVHAALLEGVKLSL